MTIRPLLALLAALPLVLAACKTTEEKLLERRRALRDTLDRTYAEYTAGAPPARDEGDAGANVLGHLASQVDRAYFDAQCLTVGRGERGFTLSPRLEAFLAEERNARACRRAADLQLEADALERKVGPGARRQGP